MTFIRVRKSVFKGDLERLLKPESEDAYEISTKELPVARSIRLDLGFISFVKSLAEQSAPLANPGIFLFLPYLNRLKIFEKASTLIDLDPHQGYRAYA
jgi:hypothetical protein